MKKFLFVIFTLALFIDTALLGMFEWFRESYGVTFREIIYTIKSPLAGANNEFFRTAAPYVAPKLVMFVVIFAVAFFIFFRLGKYVSMNLRLAGKNGKESAFDLVKIIEAFLVIAATVFSVLILFGNFMRLILVYRRSILMNCKAVVRIMFMQLILRPIRIS